MKLDVAAIRTGLPSLIVVGSHPNIVQSIMDFDSLLGRRQPTIKAIIGSGRRSERYFFGRREVLVPVYPSAETIPAKLGGSLSHFINVQSGRRVLPSTQALLEALPSLQGGTVFAERVPEQHALELASIADKRQVWIIGGSSVGILVPGHLKLSAIGGVDARQLEQSRVFNEGQVAVISSSGGMVNEIIRMVAQTGTGVSFAVAIGGERYPLLTAADALLAAEADPHTKAIAYFGELGGDDEYRIVELVAAGRLTKPIAAYIAGSVSELFETPPQFGHAKAMAATKAESATAKREALRTVGVHAAATFGEFARTITESLALQALPEQTISMEGVMARTPALFASSVSYDIDGEVRLLGEDLLEFAENHSFAEMVVSLWLGRQARSPELVAFADFVLRLLVDHGPYVSGAVNTMITARAGKDLVASLAAGLLTIGPRFGGAINQAAETLQYGVAHGVAPAQLVESFAAKRQRIAGIGHKKYRSDRPDPRVARLLRFADQLAHKPYTHYALAIESETLQKKANLILNVDGAIAAVMLDMLTQEEGMAADAVTDLIQAGYFNAFFVLSRSVGFMAHYFDQVRLDEGLFRLDESQIIPIEET